MKKQWFYLLAVPLFYLITTGSSCNDCSLDAGDLTELQDQLGSYEKSKKLNITYSSAKKTANISLPSACDCFYTGEDVEKEARDHFGVANNQNDPLLLRPIDKIDLNPTLDPAKDVFSRLGNVTGCPSCTGGTTGGGVRPPKPPVPPVGDEEFGFDKSITTFLAGPPSSIGGKADFTEVSLITKQSLGRPTFYSLAPSEAWKGTIDGHEYFYTNYNGYMVAVVDLGDEGVLRIASFNGERVQWAIKNLKYN